MFVQIYVEGDNGSVLRLGSALVGGVLTLIGDFVVEVLAAYYTLVVVKPDGMVSWIVDH